MKKLKKFCPMCGKEVNFLTENKICTNCEKLMRFRTKYKRTNKKSIDIIVCKICGKMKKSDSKDWFFPKESDIKIAEKEGFKERICDSCSKMLGGYYEAIVQFRGSAEFVEDMKERMIKEIEKSKEKNAFISSIEKVRGGLDLKIGSNTLAKKFVRKVKKNKKVEIKYSKKLKTKKNGKEIYRFTYLLREVDEYGKRKKKKR